jgi:type II secretory pathway pseudopilin PulG
MNREKLVALVLVALAFAGAAVGWYAVTFDHRSVTAALAGLWTLNAIVQVYAHLWPRDRDFEDRVELRRRLRRHDG